MSQPQMLNWSPNQGDLIKVVTILRDVNNPNKTKELQESIIVLSQHPEWPQYLAYIILNCTNEDEQVREFSGILLTHYIEQNLTKVSAALISHLKACCLQMLTSPSDRVRKRGAILISAILKAGNLSIWPELVPALAQALQTAGAPGPALEGVLTAAAIVCSDQGACLDDPAFGRPLVTLLPALLAHFASPSEPQRYLALKAVSEFLVDFPGALVAQEQALLAGLVALAKDGSARVRQLVCRAFVTLSEVHVDVVAASMPDIIEYAMASMRDSDPLVALEAADLWQAVAEQDLCRAPLRAALPRLVPLLLEKMVYSQEDIQAIEEEERELAARPAHFTRGGSGGDDDDDDVNDDDCDYGDGGSGEWSLRKASAAGLDALALGLGSEILPHLLPLLDKMTSSSNTSPNASSNTSSSTGESVPEWAEQEALVLAIGAVSEGCKEGMAQYLPNVLPFLMAKARDPHMPVRSTAFWAIGRYSEWIIEDVQSRSGGGAERYLCPAIELCAAGLLDPADKAREAACSALATIEENAGDTLVPYMIPVLQALMRVYAAAAASPKAVCLYDPIGTLIDAVGDAFRCEQCAALVVPPFMHKLQSIDVEDPHMIPLLECLATVAAELGPGIQPYAERLYAKALQVLQEALTSDTGDGDIASNVSESSATSDLLICGLDLVGALVGSLGQAVDTLLARAPVLPALAECCKMHAPSVRQSAFALVGDLAINCLSALQPHLGDILPALARGIKTAYPRVYNNATWALGEITLRAPAAVQPFLAEVLPIFTDLLKKPKKKGADTRMLYLNTVAALGRIALAFPAALAPSLATFLDGWCSFMDDIPDAKEKEDAFSGLYTLIKANPQASLTALPSVLAAIAAADFGQSNPQLKGKLLELLVGYKAYAGPANWQQIYAGLPQKIRDQLASNYNFS